MADRLKTARARQIIIDALKKDLMGPESEEERHLRMKSETLLSMIAIRHCPEYGKEFALFQRTNRFLMHSVL